MSKWKLKSVDHYIDDEGYEVFIDEEKDEDGNAIGIYDVWIWMIKGGYYDTLEEGFKSYDEARNWMIENLEMNGGIEE